MIDVWPRNFRNLKVLEVVVLVSSRVHSGHPLRACWIQRGVWVFFISCEKRGFLKPSFSLQSYESWDEIVQNEPTNADLSIFFRTLSMLPFWCFAIVDSMFLSPLRSVATVVRLAF